MRTCSAVSRGIALVRAAVVMECIIHSAPLVALTIAQPTPDPWFSVSIQIDGNSLPPGVEFKPREWNAGGFAGDFLNSTSTPFYLVKTPTTPPNWVRHLPANIVPTCMAVSGAWFTMEEPGEWTRETGEGIPVGRFLTLPSDQSAAVAFEMDAYLGNHKISIGGRYIREWTRPSSAMRSRVDRLELNSPLPEPLRLSERGDPRIVNDGPVPLYAPLRITQSGDPRVLPTPQYAGTVFSQPVGWVTEVPFGFLAVLKLVAGKSYFPELKPPSSHYGLSATTPDGWRETPSWDSAPKLTERDFQKYVPGFKSRQVYRDDRPSDASVPAAFPFNMTAFYGNRQITISGRIVYALNPKYHPQAGRGGAMCMSCTGSMCDECAKINARVRRKESEHK